MPKDLRSFLYTLPLVLMISALIGIGYFQICKSAVIRDLTPALERWTDIIAVPQTSRLNEIADMNHAARDRFLDRLGRDGAAGFQQGFDQAFPEYGDGTRRSDPRLFDGLTGADNERIYGIGAFIGDADEMSAAQQGWFWHGYETVRTLGPERSGPQTSLYYFTPDRRVVLFAPDRPDRLEFYRIEAPADFNLRGDEDALLFGAETNPRRELQCTRISRFISEDSGERTGMACRVPVWQNDVLVGAFGSSFDVTALLDASAYASLPGGTIWLLDRDNMVMTRHAHENHGEHSHGIAEMLEQISPGDMAGTGFLDNSLFAFRRIPHADWLLIACVQIKAVTAPLARRAMVLSLAIFVLLSLVAALKTGVLPRLLPPWTAPRRGPAE